MVSDCKNLSQIDVKFTPGRPFLPFEQLMAVQPASSCKLLPEPYRHLMTETNSPISDFYPENFAIDMEGKRAEWEGVVQIPFIDENRLLKAINSVPTGSLTANERKRNSQGNVLIFSHDSKSKDVAFCQSTLPRHFSDVSRCNSTAMERPAPPPLPAGEAGFRPKLINGTKTGAMTVAGFPTLKTLAIYGELHKAGVDVFGMKSRKDSLILKFKDLTKGMDQSLLTAKVIGKAVINQRAWVNWPYVKESIVEKVADELAIVRANGAEQKSVGWDIDIINMKNEYLSKCGIDLGDVKLVLHVRPVEGLVRQSGGAIEKRFAKETKPFPIQITLRKNPAPDPRFDPASFLKDDGTFVGYEFKVGSKAIFLGQSHYGSVAQVTESITAPNSGLRKGKSQSIGKRYRVVIEMLPETSAQVASSAKRLLHSMKPRYTPSGRVSAMLGVTPQALGKITGNLWVSIGENRNDTIDLGLCVKDGKKGLHVPDFCAPLESANPNRKVGWAFSDALISVLKTYKHKFPSVWAVLDQERITVEKVFPGLSKDAAVEQLQKVKKWLVSQPSSRRKLVKTTSEVASDASIEIFQASLPPTVKSTNIVEMDTVAPAMLLPPIDAHGLMAIFSGGSFALADRVVAVSSSGIPPFGSRGTVVGVHDNFVEVLFDSPFTGGDDLGGRCTGNHGAVLPHYALLNLSRPHAVLNEEPTTISKAKQSTSKAPKIPDAHGHRGFGMGRGRGGGMNNATVQPTAPGKVAGKQLLDQLQLSEAPPPPPMPSGALLGNTASQETTKREHADAIWKLMMGAKK